MALLPIRLQTTRARNSSVGKREWQEWPSRRGQAGDLPHHDTTVMEGQPATINGGVVTATHSDQDPLALDVNVGDGELVGQRHVCDVINAKNELDSCVGRR